MSRVSNRAIPTPRSLGPLGGHRYWDPEAGSVVWRGPPDSWDPTGWDLGNEPLLPPLISCLLLAFFTGQTQMEARDGEPVEGTHIGEPPEAQTGGTGWWGRYRGAGRQCQHSSLHYPFGLWLCFWLRAVEKEPVGE